MVWIGLFCCVVVQLWLALTFPSYFELWCLGQRPILWRWLLPVPGNGEWFYRQRKNR